MTLCDCGKFAYGRQAIGPRGNQQWRILVDTCTHCGKHHAVHAEHLTPTQRQWLDRRNAGIGRRIA
jgi:hypothetical protein